MNEFILLIKGDGNFEFSKEEIAIRRKKYEKWMEEQLEKGSYVWGQPLKPEGLHLLSKQELVSDGPFLEPKEMIGGIIIIRAINFVEAKKIALSCPLLDEFEIFLRPASMEM
ncbi:YciI family protein [Fulvivirgaceae bacterium BMA12]|uniref:YciI family protein n=1 Tax=Agaribacillus aureus TaxID=3051825 RepID=A0ABT8LIY4_9BACT|nr:YciI family protein [Fulvivirgaceae bacterium BMA12]